MVYSKIEMINKKFGKLSVESRAYDWRGHIYWNCICECGRKIIVRGAVLRNEDSKSCKICASTSHNESGTKIYGIWTHMIQRCTNPNDKAYKNYGGRGIKVCQRWLGEYGFENFLADKGQKPEGKTLDRWPDKNGDYTPENTRWATSVQQNRNRRNNKLTLEKSNEIRERYNNEKISHKKLGKQYNVTDVMIGKIIRGKNWSQSLEG